MQLQYEIEDKAHWVKIYLISNLNLHNLNIQRLSKTTDRNTVSTSGTLNIRLGFVMKWGLPPCFHHTDNKHFLSSLCSASVHGKLTRLQQNIVEKKAGSTSSPFTVSLGRSKKYWKQYFLRFQQVTWIMFGMSMKKNPETHLFQKWHDQQVVGHWTVGRFWPREDRDHWILPAPTSPGALYERHGSVRTRQQMRVTFWNWILFQKAGGVKKKKKKKKYQGPHFPTYFW